LPLSSVMVSQPIGRGTGPRGLPQPVAPLHELGVQHLQVADLVKDLAASAFAARQGAAFAYGPDPEGADGHAEPGGVDGQARALELGAGLGHGPAMGGHGSATCLSVHAVGSSTSTSTQSQNRHGPSSVLSGSPWRATW